MSDEVTQETTDEVQETTEETQETVTAEQFQELKEKYEQIMKAQSGSDKKVKQLMAELEKAREEKVNTEKTAEERLAEVEQKLTQAEAEKLKATQKGFAQQLLADKGLKAPSFIDRLIGDNAEETEAAVNEYIESIEQVKHATADEFVRKNGRKVVDTKPGTWDGLTYKDLAAMPKEEFNRVPVDVVDRIMESTLKK